MGNPQKKVRSKKEQLQLDRMATFHALRRAIARDPNLADRPRTDLYQAMLPALNSGKVTLLDSKSLVNQIANLERRVARGGRESIDHPPNGHDDLANSVAGVISLCAKPVRSAAVIRRVAFGAW